MPERNPPLVSPSGHADVRYEKSDARGGAIIMLGALLAVLGLIVLVSANWLFDFLKGSERRKYQPLPALAAKQRIHLPRNPDEIPEIPEPYLQISEPLDLARLRQEEDAKLIGFGWVVNREKGIERISAEVVQMLTDPKIAEAKGIRVRESKK